MIHTTTEDRPINVRSMKITILGYLGALLVMTTLLAIPIVLAFVLKALVM